jgi:hypothetical protein
MIEIEIKSSGNITKKSFSKKLKKFIRQIV